MSSIDRTLMQITGAMIINRNGKYDVIYKEHIVAFNLSYERALDIALSKKILDELILKKKQIKK